MKIESGGYGIIGEKCPNTPSNCETSTKVYFVQVDDEGLNNENEDS